MRRDQTAIWKWNAAKPAPLDQSGIFSWILRSTCPPSTLKNYPLKCHKNFSRAHFPLHHRSAMQQVCVVTYGLAKVSSVGLTVPKIEGTLSGLEMSQHSEHRRKHTYASLGGGYKNKHAQNQEPFVWEKIRDCHRDEVVWLPRPSGDKQVCSVLLNKSWLCDCDHFGKGGGDELFHDPAYLLAKNQPEPVWNLLFPTLHLEITPAKPTSPLLYSFRKPKCHPADKCQKDATLCQETSGATVICLWAGTLLELLAQ